MLKPVSAPAMFVAAVVVLPVLAGAVLAGAVLAQQSDPVPPAPAPSASAPSASAPSASAPNAPAAAPGAPAPTAARPLPPMPPGVVATTNNPNLSVANVKLESGLRLGRMLGAPVQNERGERLGHVDDVVLAQDNRVSLAVISVGGFLGLGSKLVAVPWTQLRPETDRVVLPGVNQEQLNEMPSLIY